AGQLHLRQLFAEKACLSRETLHHFTRLGILFQQIVNILHRSAAALSDPSPARTVDQHVISAFLRSHRVDDSYDTTDFVLVNLGILEIFQWAHLWHHIEQLTEWTQLLQLLD